MNHQPFETWLFTEDTLTPEDADALSVHLESCEYCRELQAALTGVFNLFEDFPQMEPDPGFMDRWEVRLSEERQVNTQMRHRWQSVIMLILIANVIAGLAFLLGTQFFATVQTPADLIMPWIYRFTSALTFVNGVQNLAVTLFRTFTSIVPVGLWAVLGAGLLASGAVWIISMKTLSVLPRRNLQ
jgi:hypothetical protein